MALVGVIEPLPSPVMLPLYDQPPVLRIFKLPAPLMTMLLELAIVPVGCRRNTAAPLRAVVPVYEPVPESWSVPAVTSRLPPAPLMLPTMLLVVPPADELKVAPVMSRVLPSVMPPVPPSQVSPDVPVAVTGPFQVTVWLLPPPMRRIAPFKASVLAKVVVATA